MAALVLMAVGLLAAELDYSLAVVLFSMSNLSFTSLFLQHIRRRRWLLLLGLAAFGYALLALAVLALLPWPDWAAPAAAYLGFLFAAVVSALASRFRWAGIGAMVSALGDLAAISRVRDWPHPSDLNALTWILAFSGLAVMVAGVVQGPSKPFRHG
ncbi:hypothetical protein [Thermaurantiacus sp.]